MSTVTQIPQNFPSTAPEDVTEPGVEAQLIPFIVYTTLRAEQSSNGPPPLSPTEAGNLVEILDKVVSSAAADPHLRNGCFRVLRRVSQTHGVLPKSYFPPGVTLSDDIAYASGGFADVWKGQLDGNQVCVKAFRTQTPGNLEKIKRRFYREIVGWKYVSHPNVLPFLGVSETFFPFCLISPWLANGNIAEYVQKHQWANRLQLLAQAACGLEYLHTLNIVHSDINPGNILITEEGNARLGDFGITSVITDPTVVAPGSTTTSKPGVVRYMAPELLNPSQYHLGNSKSTKSSDVYSIATTAFEILTGILPYGQNRDGIIIFHVITNERPTRPADARWLRDDVWAMITTCWSERWEERWGIHAVYNQFWTSSIQEAPIFESDVGTAQTLNMVAITPLPPPPLPVKLKDPPVQQDARDKQSRSYTAPVVGSPRATAPKKRFTFPALHRGGDTIERNNLIGQGTRKSDMLSRSWSKLRKVANALRSFLWPPGTDGRASR